jgi:glycosyltransferase involved in cell wall biosynthesis
MGIMTSRISQGKDYENLSEPDVRPQSVLFVLASLQGGGAERVMVTILQHLDRTLFEPHLALVESRGVFIHEVPADVPIHDLKAGRARYAIPPLLRLVWRLRPNVILSTLGYLNLVMIVARLLLPKRTRLIVREGITVSSYLAIDEPHPLIWRSLYRLLYKRADCIVCQSDNMLIDFAENFGVPLSKLTRIYNPVDIDRINCLADVGKNPYCGVGPHVVSAGRLSHQKGFDVLLNAMAQVRRHFPTVELTILGEGELRLALEGMRDQLGLKGAVHFLGFKTNPYPYFKHAHLFVLASRYEGLANVLLEALALGTPVVAADCPGGAREVAGVHKTLKLVRIDGPAALAQGIIDALQRRDGNTNTFRESGNEFCKMFGVRGVVAEYERLLGKETDASSF